VMPAALQLWYDRGSNMKTSMIMKYGWMVCMGTWDGMRPTLDEGSHDK